MQHAFSTANMQVYHIRFQVTTLVPCVQTCEQINADPLSIVQKNPGLQ
jgi:hypothetical protein